MRDGWDGGRKGGRGEGGMVGDGRLLSYREGRGESGAFVCVSDEDGSERLRFYLIRSFFTVPHTIVSTGLIQANEALGAVEDTPFPWLNGHPKRSVHMYISSEPGSLRKPTDARRTVQMNTTCQARGLYLRTICDCKAPKAQPPSCMYPQSAPPAFGTYLVL